MKLIIPMATIVVSSNILVQYTLGSYFTWGAFTYPFAFLINDLTNRWYGAGQARKVVWWGFGTGILCSAITALVNPDLITWRVAIGSGIAFLAAQMLDIQIFDKLRNHRDWRVAPAVSSIVGSLVDTAIFFTIAFSAWTLAVIPDENTWALGVTPLVGIGPECPLWVSLAVADWVVKMTLVVVALGLYWLPEIAHKNND